MPFSENTAQDIEHLIQWCEQHASGYPPSALLPQHWFQCHRGLPYPPWIDIARHLFQYPEDQVRTVLTHAQQLHGQRTGAELSAAAYAFFQRPSDGFNQTYTPECILRYAAWANGWHKSAQCLETNDLPTRLLRTALSASPNARAYGPLLGDELSLTQMLVHQSSRHHQGLLLALNLQTVDSTPQTSDLFTVNHAGQLFPAPAAALLHTDALFKHSLSVVQKLLSQVLQPGAPAIAWSFASLALPADRHQSFAHIEGASASAALAYGALYLLRKHLDTTQPQVARLAEHLHTIEAPHTVSVTAELVPGGDPAQPWPLLDLVDGVPEKLAALATSLPLGRQVSHRFVASKQKEGATVTIEAEGAQDLGDLVEKIAGATTSLDEDGRRLHAKLQQDRNTLSDAAIAADPGMDKADLFREAIKTFVRVQAAKRLAALGGTQPNMPDTPRERKAAPQ